VGKLIPKRHKTRLRSLYSSRPQYGARSSSQTLKPPKTYPFVLTPISRDPLGGKVRLKQTNRPESPNEQLLPFADTHLPIRLVFKTQTNASPNQTTQKRDPSLSRDPPGGKVRPKPRNRAYMAQEQLFPMVDTLLSIRLRLKFKPNELSAFFAHRGRCDQVSKVPFSTKTKTGFR